MFPVETIPILRVYADATIRGGQGCWGAVVVTPGRKMHVMGGSIYGPRTSESAEAIAAIMGRDAAKRWMRRNSITANLLIVHGDNANAQETLQRDRGDKRTVYRWVGREHPALVVAHRWARWLAAQSA
ncbi:hypothetical protein [Azospirillum sp. TSO5]|uniref:hypothetical protein n=1 Tax=Azospirillum sp. TSO5 TaxID=716760 RepID=UPI000D61C86D|nr:hypothetical protein [Azospirillum sp. TSO5]PWC98062.1 hypothetical protein TSO5_03420 [Azospirillum sp. TSO5]